MAMTASAERIETDFLGSVSVPDAALFGLQAAAARAPVVERPATWAGGRRRPDPGDLVRQSRRDRHSSMWCAPRVIT